MIQKMSFFAGVLILFLSLPEKAECAPSGSDQRTLTYEARLSGKVYGFALESEGNYYLAENWAEGEVILLSGEKVTGEHFKYNAYLDELIWLSVRNHQPVQIDKQMVKQFSIKQPGASEPRVFQRLSLQDGPYSHLDGKYLELLHDGIVSVFVHRRIVQSGERMQSVEGSLRAVPQLTADPLYYIITPGDQIKELSRFGRRALQAMFPNRQQEVRSLLRREQPMIRSEADLIRAISLIEKNILP